MHRHYADILALSPTPPHWFDEHAVPRFCEFAPSEVANIYAREAALLLIECQACGTRFRVAMTFDPTDWANGEDSSSDRVRIGSLDYGDPPNVGCCPAGPTMKSDARKVVEFWRREHFDWERMPELEVRLDGEDDEAKAGG